MYINTIVLRQLRKQINLLNNHKNYVKISKKMKYDRKNFHGISFDSWINLAPNQAFNKVIDAYFTYFEAKLYSAYKLLLVKTEERC
jgi:hypothetical protein